MLQSKIYAKRPYLLGHHLQSQFHRLRQVDDESVLRTVSAIMGACKWQSRLKSCSQR